jgi:GxxExxY protein
MRILSRRHGDTELRREMNENEIGTIVVDCAVKIHMELGPGLLESLYEAVLGHELRLRGLQVDRQVPVSIEYQGLRFEEGFRADLIVDGKVILELKSVERLTNAHKKQLLTYLRLTGMKVGYLFNFGEALMKDGISRIIHGHITR